MKIYKCSSQISISVMLANGHSKHISFDPMSDGSSLYFTDDKNVQDAIEKHKEYGKCIWLMHEDKEPENSNADSNPNENSNSNQNANEQTGPEEMTFESVDDAREYLANEYAISRTKMRGVKATKEAGLTVGIKVIISNE